MAMSSIRGLVRMAIAKGSIDKANNIGDKGQPCLFPQVSMNSEEFVPLTLT